MKKEPKKDTQVLVSTLQHSKFQQTVEVGLNKVEFDHSDTRSL